MFNNYRRLVLTGKRWNGTSEIIITTNTHRCQMARLIPLKWWLMVIFLFLFFLTSMISYFLGDCGLGIPVVRTASIRRQQLRGSNNSINNNSPRIVRSHGRHQRSPMLHRSSKRRQDIEQSTASLNSVNSIEVWGWKIIFKLSSFILIF